MCEENLSRSSDLTSYNEEAASLSLSATVKLIVPELMCPQLPPGLTTAQGIHSLLSVYSVVVPESPPRILNWDSGSCLKGCGYSRGDSSAGLRALLKEQEAQLDTMSLIIESLASLCEEQLQLLAEPGKQYRASPHGMCQTLETRHLPENVDSQPLPVSGPRHAGQIDRKLEAALKSQLPGSHRCRCQ